MNATLHRLAKAMTRLGGPRPEVVDRARWDWYGDSCPCGVAPGKCKVHHRARAEQRPPAGDEWRTWLALCGRAWGKTRTGAEWVIELARTRQADRIALVAPTAADARDVMVEGESGILNVSAPWFRPRYEPSKRRLTFPNGVVATTYSADEPAAFAGATALSSMGG
jgi:phage terminase large subunit-like protein